MRKFLLLLALLVALAAVLTWAVTGANRGWTKTSVPIKTTDPVTGIDGITYQPKFLPGVDFLGAALAGAVVLAGSSFFFRKNKTNNTTNNQ
jgi:hypothetical protein